MKQTWPDRLARQADLPGESLPQIPIVELAGDSRVLIEQHKGLCSYGKNAIRVRVRFGEICVSGSNLSLARMTGEQLVISGRIDAVTICRGNP